MASTSASSVQNSFKYDVFLSFRGEDTRKTFVDHLYHALVNKGIITYKDDVKIDKGERISEQLIRSIEESRFYIIVFSKDYASSSWCLDELVKIMECQKMTEHTAYPVFYDVEPTEVRKQSGSVGLAFDKHVNEESAGRWRNAMKEAAGLAGWELKKTADGHEAQFIQKIVIGISQKLHFLNWSFDEKLVGMEVRVKEIISSLEIASDDVRMIGIKGMGGGGKTTLARAVFDLISISFEGKSFAEDVREVSKRSGLKKLQEQVLEDVSNEKGIIITSVFDGKIMMKKRMRSRKVLVILDDVDDIGQLEALAGELTWFKPGSRIIITTRDEQVLVAHGVNFIHDVCLLSHEEAICLLTRYAFKREIPDQGYEELTRKVVHYAAGLPLTIKVLGSHLCRRSEREWEDVLERLKKIPLKETLEKLELSFNGLENDHKEMFLDVACLLRGMKKKEAIQILESCGFHAEYGLRVLEQKSLLTISDFGRILLHDHIEEMGMNIVRRLHSEEPNRLTRLWITEEIDYILANELGTEATTGIKLENTCLNPDTIMKGLRKMKELRFLHISYGKWEIEKVGQYFPNTLRSLNWLEYPFWCLPKTFQANKLVNLDMRFGNISQLWKGGVRKVLDKLRFLNLSYTKLKTFDLRLTPNIEELYLEGCKDFVELNMPDECPKLKILNLNGSMLSNLDLWLTPHLEELYLSSCCYFVRLLMHALCPKLKILNLSGSMLRNLDLGMTPHLEELYLGGCNYLVELNIPNECPELKFLDLSDSKLCNLNLGLAPHLEELYLSRCRCFINLQKPNECSKLKILNLSGSIITKLNLGLTPQLEELHLNHCHYLVELLMPTECPKLRLLRLDGSKVSSFNLGLAPNIKELNFEGCGNFLEINIPTECPNLIYLNLNYSKVSNLNLGLTTHLKEIHLRGCRNLVELHMPVECPNLKNLNLNGSKVRNLNLRLTPHLEELFLEGCGDFVELYMPVKCPNLKYLNLNGSKVSHLNLGLTPHLEELYLEGCNGFVELNMPVEHPNLNLRYLNLNGSKVSNLNIGLTAHLKELYLKGCNDLVELHMPVECPNLKNLNLNGSKVSNLNLGLTPHLEELYLEGCANFVELHIPVECPNLKYVNLNGSKVSNLNLGRTPYLKELYLEGCNDFVELIVPVQCSQLKVLNLGSSKLSNLNHGQTPWFRRLDGLEVLTLSLKEIKHLPDSICMLKHLKSLRLISCLLLEHLPKDLGTLECLEELYIIDCISLQDIPNSICNMERLERLHLPYCVVVEKLPDEIGRLRCLKVLNIEGTCINHLPQSIFQLYGLCIEWSRGQLERYGFGSLNEISYNTSSYTV